MIKYLIYPLFAICVGIILVPILMFLSAFGDIFFRVDLEKLYEANELLKDK